jgi:hypothetical protein
MLIVTLLCLVVGAMAASLRTSVSYLWETEFDRNCDRVKCLGVLSSLDTMSRGDSAYLLKSFYPKEGYNYYIQSPRWGAATGAIDTVVMQLWIKSYTSAGTLLSSKLTDTMQVDSGRPCPLNLFNSNSTEVNNYGIYFDVMLLYVNFGSSPYIRGPQRVTSTNYIKLFKARPVTYYKQL